MFSSRRETARISVYGPGSSSQPEAAFEENGELGFRHAPFAGRHLPLFLRLPQDQEQQLERTLVGGKVPAGPHRPAQFGIERLNGVGGVDDPAHLLGEGKERDHRRPAAPPGGRDGLILRPQTEVANASRAVWPASAPLAR